MASTTAELRGRTPHKNKSRNPSQLGSLEQAGLFLKNFLRHPLMLGSAIPSSRYLISRVLDQVEWPQVRTAVEYGPGVGTFTRPILSRLSRNANLLAIELNTDFADLLRSDTADPRLKVAHGSCADVVHWMREHQLGQAEFILSGIPYTVLDPGVRQKILTATRNALCDEGVFVVYQYTRAVLPDLQQVFSRVEDDFEPLNILPARLFFCRK
jgi:phospholipid N-methyltransferase